ncbi:GNAT family N-acetyltransferase [Aureimonas sp. ME7]|uniref:GNAT family N-acetyltransferase n=1 Tax=Aureimonas sp. ME7 TaxID=2744252 RepID=UPI0015F7393A|nr:GNAT family N-acetyltransferase [Aureimonas sp. ME7]
MLEADIEAVMALSERVHPTFFERREMFADRLALFGQGCLVLPDQDEELAGYAIAYPAPFRRPPPIDTVLGALPTNVDSLYIHDVAVAPEWRGHHLADRAVESLLRLAEPFGAAMLVSVYGTSPFWSRFGFSPLDEPEVRRWIAPYGEDAVFMTRSNNRQRENVRRP